MWRTACYCQVDSGVLFLWPNLTFFCVFLSFMCRECISFAGVNYVKCLGKKGIFFHSQGQKAFLYFPTLRENLFTCQMSHTEFFCSRSAPVISLQLCVFTEQILVERERKSQEERKIMQLAHDNKPTHVSSFSNERLQ